MRLLADRMSRLVAVLGVVLILMVPQLGYSQAVEEEPSMLAMVGDLVLARPILLAVTVGGAVAYAVSLPFSLAGGNAKEAGQTLVVGPAQATFVRCLGCTRSGYKKTRKE
ncbi:MAG: hypothetical protein JKY66_03765 [Spongiibacteraceae bacterium]|nr:hypothetical protein [Spongiibacteraceae bacterium]